MTTPDLTVRKRAEWCQPCGTVRAMLVTPILKSRVCETCSAFFYQGRWFTPPVRKPLARAA